MSARAGVSTLGVLFGYGVGTQDTKPETFTLLERVNSIGGITLSTEQIDASALEDMVSKYVAGRQDTGGTFDVTFNFSDDVAEQLEAMISAYKELTEQQRMWFTVWSPYLTKAFFVIAQPPQSIPMPEMGQNGLMTVATPLTIEEYKGLDVAVKPTPTEAATTEATTTGA